MKLVSPQEVNDVTLVSTNVADGDYTDWVAGSYNQGDRVVVGIEIYEALTTTTDEPITGSVLSPPTWLRLGYINRWKMFKNASDSKTVNLDTVDVTLNTGQVVTSVAVLGCVGLSVQVIVEDPTEGVVYDKTELLQDIGVTDWWEYYFLDYSTITDVVFTDLPPYSSSSIRIIVSNTVGSDAEVGLVTLGSLKELGVTVYGTTVGTQNFSVRERDGFGNLTITPRRSIDIVNYDVKVPTSQVAFIKRELQSVANTPTLFIGDEAFEATIIYGVVEDFRENISTPVLSDMTLEVRSI